MCRRFRLPHPGLRRAPRIRTVGLWNPASREPVRVRGDQVFGEHFRATTDAITDDFFPDEDFFPDIGSLYIDDMADDVVTTAAATAAATATAAAAAALPYVLLNFLF